MSKILSLAAEANFYLYRKPVKMSKSFDGLAALIRTELDKDIITGDVFLFLNRHRTTVKIFVYENKGFSIFYRRLDEGSFQLPSIVGDDLNYKMSSEQKMYMLSGMTLEDGGYVKAEKYEPLHGALI
jgi:transposase